MSHGIASVKQLRDTYVTQGLPLEQCAKLIGVATSTAWRWKRDARRLGDDWDLAQRQSLPILQTSAELLEAVTVQAVQQCSAMLEEIRSNASLGPIERAQALALITGALTSRHPARPARSGKRGKAQHQS